MIRGIALLIVLSSVGAAAQGTQAADETRIRQIIASQSDGWNRGSVEDYTARFKNEGVYTIIIGNTYETRAGLQDRVRGILSSIFKGSVIVQKVRSVRFLSPTVAVVDAEAEMTGFKALPAGIQGSPGGKLLTSMLQVLVKENGDWWVAAWHNVELVP